MLTRVAYFFTIITILIIEVNYTCSYKTLEDLKTRFKKLENEKFTSTDMLVGKAVDFMYSDRTMLSLLAGELWDVGTRAIDKLVEVKVKNPDKRVMFSSIAITPTDINNMYKERSRFVLILLNMTLLSQIYSEGIDIRDIKNQEKKDYTPTKWVTNSAMDVWYGNKSMIDVTSRTFSNLVFNFLVRKLRSTNMEDYKLNNTAFHESGIRPEHIRVDIRFINALNETIHTMSLDPVKQLLNSSKFIK